MKKWVKTSTSKNLDTIVSLEDNRMLNNVYPPDQLPDFRIRARPPPPRRGSVSQPPTSSDSEEHEMDTYQPPAPEHPPTSGDLMQKLVSDVQNLSKQ